MKRKSAFTLIEFLVVIGIITLLIAILMPTLARARMAAVRTVCLSNLRQSGMAITLYAQSNKNTIYLAGSGSAMSGQNYTGWAFAIVYGFNSRYQSTGTPLVSPMVARCPLNPYYEVTTCVDYKGTTFETVDGSDANRPHTSTYGIFNLSEDDLTYRKWNWEGQALPIVYPPPPGADSYSLRFARQSRIPRSAELVMLADTFTGTAMSPAFSNIHGKSYFAKGTLWTAHGVRGSVRLTGATFTGLTASGSNKTNVRNTGVPIGIPNYTDARCNVLSFDGHAESLTVEELRHSPQLFQFFYDLRGRAGRMSRGG